MFMVFESSSVSRLLSLSGSSGPPSRPEPKPIRSTKFLQFAQASFLRKAFAKITGEKKKGCEGMQQAFHNSSCRAVRCLIIPREKASPEEDLLPPSEALQQSRAQALSCLLSAAQTKLPTWKDGSRYQAQVAVSPVGVEGALLHLARRDSRRWSWPEY